MISYANHEPKVHESVFIADSAAIIGDVEIGEGSSVWFGAVIRSDNNIIRIGKNVNVQDGVIIHEDLEDEVHIGDNVTIGHRAIIHGCTIGSNVMIGMGAILLNGCVIGNNCVVAAGALVTGGTVVPENSLILGAPAKTIKPLSDALKADIDFTVQEYAERARDYKAGDYKQA